MSSEVPKLSGRHEDTLRQIFAHPLSHNVERRAVVALLNEVGSVTERGDHLEVVAGGQTVSLVTGHPKDLDADELVVVRHFLEALGYHG